MRQNIKDKNNETKGEYETEEKEDGKRKKKEKRKEKGVIYDPRSITVTLNV